MTGVYSYSPYCKHCIGIKTNDIGETVVYCECSDSWRNVTLGECFDNCEAQETTDGRKPWRWGGTTAQSAGAKMSEENVKKESIGRRGGERW